MSDKMATVRGVRVPRKQGVPPRRFGILGRGWESLFRIGVKRPSWAPVSQLPESHGFECGEQLSRIERSIVVNELLLPASEQYVTLVSLCNLQVMVQ
jgi:hypothetical protein